MSTLSNIKRNLSLWSKIILLFKAYWYIILDIDELPNRISNIFGKSPSKVIVDNDKYKFVSTPPTITNEKNWTSSNAAKEFAKATGRTIIKPGYARIGGDTFEVGKGYSSSYTEQREMSSWNKQ